MRLSFHLLIHFLLATASGIIPWLFLASSSGILLFLALLGGSLGGVLIDLDHFIDYFLCFGNSFKLKYFNNGYQFLKTGKIRIFFHSWELVLIWLVLGFSLNHPWQLFFLSLGLGSLTHLIADVFIDRMPVKSYLLIYRLLKKFEIKTLVSEEHYKNHQRIKRKMKIN